MADPSALVLQRDPCGAMRLVEPVPPLAVVAVRALVHAHVREWLMAGDDPAGDMLDVCGQAFRVIGWHPPSQLGPAGLLVEHVGPADTPRCTP